MRLFRSSPGNVLHGDEIGRRPSSRPRSYIRQTLRWEIVRARRELVPEALDRLGVGGDLGLEELEGDLLPDLGVEDLVDAAHAALAQLLDDLVAAGEGRPGRQLADGRAQGFGRGRRAAFGAERGGAPAAETRAGRIVETATRTLHPEIPENRLPVWFGG